MTTITFHPYAPGASSSEGNRLGSIDPRLSRTNYFDGQLLKASDLTRDQIYLDERLLELGQVLGSGIAQGLEVTLVENHLLTVTPGIAVAPSGRVLQLSGKTLEINLQDSGFIADLNKGLYRRFNRGLYAIALRYAEMVDMVSEAYPADLASRRRMQVSSYAEGVELALIPLNITLPRGDEITIRAALAQQFISHDGRFNLPTDEAVALGLIAIDNARPLWLDLGLLRRPLRNPNTPNALQLDLASHYQELFADVLTSRQKGGRNDDFAASSYFRLLPPFGPVPKEALDPVNGRQGFFPQDFEVAIAPVRHADLAAIMEESAHLAPIDLSRDADADIMVLVPMSDQSFALRARQLEKSAQAQLPVINKLPYFNSLALRLFTQPPAHLVDTDAAAWKAIWQEVDSTELIYVRRPPRTAETNVSAVVLARGFALPDPAAALPPDLAKLDVQLDKALEEKVIVEEKLSQKEGEITTLQQKIKQLEEALGGDADLNAALAEIQELKADLAAAAEEITALQASAGDAAVFKTALEAATDKITKLSAELEFANEKIAELQAAETVTDAAAEQKIKELSDALDKANAAEAELRDERDNLELKLVEAELKINGLTIEMEQLRTDLDAARSSSSRSDADLAAAKVEIDTLNVLIKALTDQQQSLQADLTGAQQKFTNAEAKANSATLSLKDALTLLQTSQADLNTRDRELVTTKQTITSLQTLFDNADKRITDLQAQLAQRSALSSLFPLVELAKMRRADADATAAEKLEEQVGDLNSARQAVIHLLTLTPANFDKALWPSLVSVAGTSPKNLLQLRGLILKSLAEGVAVPNAYLNNGAALGMTSTDLNNWKSLVG